MLLVHQQSEMLQEIFAQVVEFLEKLGFLVEREKCSSLSCQRIVFPGGFARLHNNDTFPSSAKTNQHCGYMPSPTSSKECLSEDSVHPNWTNKPCIADKDLTCPNSLQSSSTSTPASGVSKWSVLISLTSQALGDLEWWISPGSSRLNGSPFQLPPIDETIWTDALKQGWGVSYQGLSTGDHWSEEEAKAHINVLELRAATFALKALLRAQESQPPPTPPLPTQACLPADRQHHSRSLHQQA